MAYVNGTEVKVVLSRDGFTTELLPCTEQDLTFTVNGNLVDIANKCNDGWLAKVAFGLKDWSITGTLDAEDGQTYTYQDAMDDTIAGTELDVRLDIPIAGGDVVRYEGKAYNNTETFSAPQGAQMTYTLDLMGNGPLTVTTVTP